MFDTFRSRWMRTANTVEEPRLPFEIIGEIAEYLTGPYDLMNLCLTSKTVHSTLTRVRYRTVILEGNKTCLRRLQFLIAHQHLAALVQILIIAPNYLQLYEPKGLIEEAEIAKTLELLVPNLCELQKFIWDGFEQPPDNLWRTLKTCCPRLKYVGSQVGARRIRPDSQLFAFDDLVGFAFKSDPRGQRTFAAGDAGEELPSTMWDMLLQRCPGLQELTLGSCYERCDPGMSNWERQFIVTPLAHATLPKLHTLILHGVRTQDVFEDDLIYDFFVRHSEHLERIDLYHAKFSKSCPHLFPLNSLAVGLHHWYLNPSAGTIKELNLCHDVISSASLTSLKPILKHLTRLVSLSIWVEISRVTYNGDRNQVRNHTINTFASVLEWAPGLEHLKYACTNGYKTAFVWTDLIPAIQQSKLKHLELWKSLKITDDRIDDAAAKYARACHTLQHITLRQTLRMSSVEEQAITQHATYQVFTGEDGSPIRMYGKSVGGAFANYKIEIDLRTSGWALRTSRKKYLK